MQICDWKFVISSFTLTCCSFFCKPFVNFFFLLLLYLSVFSKIRIGGISGNSTVSWPVKLTQIRPTKRRSAKIKAHLRRERGGFIYSIKGDNVCARCNRFSFKRCQSNMAQAASILKDPSALIKTTNPQQPVQFEHTKRVAENNQRKKKRGRQRFRPHPPLHPPSYLFIGSLLTWRHLFHRARLIIQWGWFFRGTDTMFIPDKRETHPE